MPIIHIWPINNSKSSFNKVTIGTENTMVYKNLVYYTAIVKRWQEMRDRVAANILTDSPSAGDQTVQHRRYTHARKQNKHKFTESARELPV